jgi:hypothetical protein
MGNTRGVDALNHSSSDFIDLGSEPDIITLVSVIHDFKKIRARFRILYSLFILVDSLKGVHGILTHALDEPCNNIYDDVRFFKIIHPILQWDLSLVYSHW